MKVKKEHKRFALSSERNEIFSSRETAFGAKNEFYEKSFCFTPPSTIADPAFLEKKKDGENMFFVFGFYLLDFLLRLATPTWRNEQREKRVYLYLELTWTRLVHFDVKCFIFGILGDFMGFLYAVIYGFALLRGFTMSDANRTRNSFQISFSFRYSQIDSEKLNHNFKIRCRWSVLICNLFSISNPKDKVFS